MLRSSSTICCAIVAVCIATLGLSAICRSEEPNGANSSGEPVVITGNSAPVEGTTTLQEAEAQAKAEGVELLPLSLSEAITLSLRNNLDIRVAGYTPKISATDIDRQLSQFDPTASASLTYSSQKPPAVQTISKQKIGPATQVTKAPFQQDTSITAANGGLSVKSLSGGTIGLTTSDAHNMVTTRTTFNLPVVQKQNYYAGTLGLSVVQPLLRNAGVAFNTSGILIAKNNARVSALTFENNVMDLVLGVDQAYWNLVFTIEDLKSKEKSLQAAQDFLKNNEIKYAAGALEKVEVSRARAAVAAREQGIVVSKAAVKDAEDRLRTLLDSPRYEILSSSKLFPTDKPSIYAVEIDQDASVHEALALRPDLRELVITAESAGIMIARAKNQLLPEVDLAATYTLNGVGDSWAGGYNDIFETEHRGLAAGITFSVPLGNRAARADYASASYQKLQTLAQLASSQRNVAYAVKKAIRDIRTSLQSIDASRVAVQAAKEQLDAEVQKYAQGQSIALDVLNAQNDLQQAESTYIASVASFNIAMASYYRQTGTVLRKFGITVAAPAEITCEAGPEKLFP